MPTFPWDALDNGVRIPLYCGHNWRNKINLDIYTLNSKIFQVEAFERSSPLKFLRYLCFFHPSYMSSPSSHTWLGSWHLRIRSAVQQHVFEMDNSKVWRRHISRACHGEAAWAAVFCWGRFKWLPHDFAHSCPREGTKETRQADRYMNNPAHQRFLYLTTVSQPRFVRTVAPRIIIIIIISVLLYVR
jgi:hypothetical protein